MLDNGDKIVKPGKQDSRKSGCRISEDQEIRIQSNFFYNCRESSTNWPCFLQNKANLRSAKMNVTFFLTKDYENKTAFRAQKNKPKQSQFAKAELKGVRL